LGRIVLEGNFENSAKTNNFVIRTTGLKSGVYYLKLELDGRTEYGQMLIEN
jgi:hypothetical protein